ncbi:MAG: hypothetical protein EXS01_05915 [Phycisphaerales bacterium]|nr:hypothetical protein [Phycisphaerales bacterium]
MIALHRIFIVLLCAVGAAAPVVAQSPPETPDKPAESAPIAPVALPAIDALRGAVVEPPAAAQSSRSISPIQEAAEILASGRFLAPLIPEGGYLTRAAGSLGRDDFLGVWTFNLSDRVDGAADRSLILLPSDALADMIGRHLLTIKDGTSAPAFEVSGPILVFRSSNYLLPSFAAPINRRVDRPAAQPLAPPGSTRAVVAVAAVAAVAVESPTAQLSTPPTAAPAAVPIDPETFAAELEKRLAQRVAVIPSSSDSSTPALPAPPGVEQPSRAVAVATDTTADTMPLIEGRTTDVAESTLRSALPRMPLMPPMRLQSRRGTMTRDPITGSWRFVFASGLRDDGDVSLELLPCSMLSRMIPAARASAAVASIMLTGDITVFEGRNYLRPVRYQALTAGKWIGP